MPKLNLFDTGLVCWLLGIRTPGQLRIHPLRGPIFETWVASEIRKHRANRGNPARLGFYRDRNGAEAGLIVERPHGVTLVDARSAMTPSASLFQGAERVRRNLAEVAGRRSVVVVYGGDQVQRRGTGILVPWHAPHEVDWDAFQS